MPSSHKDGSRKLCAMEDLGLDMSNSVYALNAATSDLRLALFRWAPFLSTKTAVELHTLLNFRVELPRRNPQFL